MSIILVFKRGNSEERIAHELIYATLDRIGANTIMAIECMLAGAPFIADGGEYIIKEE